MTDNFSTPLPPAVRAAAERADALMKQQAGAPDTPPAADAQPPAPPPAADAQPPAPPPAADAQPPAPAPAPAPQQEPQNWEHRYNSMRGRYEAAERTLQSQAETIRQLEERMRSLESAAPKQEDDVLASLDLQPLSPEEEADFGPEVISLIQRKAAETMRPVVERQQREIERLRAEQAQTAQSQSQTAYQRMLDHMDTELPAWREINRDENFLRWLSYADPLSGQIRQAMLQNQWSKNNGPSVLAFFTSFLKETGQAPAAPQLPQPDKIPLENFAAPGRPQPAAPPPSPADKPIISRAYVKEFYDRKARGEFAGRDSEVEATEAMIFAAQKEGRVR